MARIPTLGPRGEGWVVLQAVLLIAVPLAAWRAALSPDPALPGLDVLRDLGGALLIASLGVIGLSVAWLRRSRALSALPRPLDTGTLVESGPYRFVRHPVYAGIIAAAAAVALIRVSPTVAVLAFALTVVLDLKRRREEAWLLERYPGYAAYRSRTKALVPFLY
ncbi:MAG TPA: isoprenylcysteine carboxylmethyltransferase family protein [Candidatus Limnocylindrales bacterium]|nr:isoprenylcysteine carboxylmethyltransferase family protein [Candidatus Limnocylindrales bacterium]